MKELYDDKDRYTSDGLIVSKEVDSLIKPVIVRLYKEGYRPRDIYQMFNERANMEAVWCRAGMHDEDKEELTD